MTSSRAQQLSFSSFCLFAPLLLIGFASWLWSAWPTLTSYNGLASLWLPALLYGLAHAARMLRLALLLGGGRLRRLLGLYAYTTACSAIIPFKLGELFRINEIGWQAGHWLKGLLIVWVERVFDMLALGAIILLVLAGGGALAEVRPLVMVIGLFVFVTFCFFFIIPEQLPALNLHVMRTYRGEKAIRILRVLEAVNTLCKLAKTLITGRLVTLGVATVVIWSFELAALATLSSSLAAPSLVQQFSDLLTPWAAQQHPPNTALAAFDQLKLALAATPGLLALPIYALWRRQHLRNGN